MAEKEVLTNTKAREFLIRGLDIVADAVKSTMGPAGRHVFFDNGYGAPRLTKDGVTVAKQITLPDKRENMGAKLLQTVANQSNDIAGDGTTATAVLAQAILREGNRAVTTGVNPVDLKRGIDAAVEFVVNHIKSVAKAVSGTNEIQQIGTISANGDLEIGEMIARAMKEVGDEGVITVEEAKSLATEVDIVKGMRIDDRGYLSPYFATNNDKMICELEDTFLLIHDKKISTVQPIIPILEQISKTGRPLVIIAEDVEGEAVTTLIFNKLRSTLRVAAIKAPGFGDRRKAMLEDIAILTGGQVLSEEVGIKLENVNLNMLGKAKRIVITKDHTTIIEGQGDRSLLDQRVAQIRQQITTTTSDYDREKLQERLAKLAGGVAVIRVGGASEVEIKERKDRVDDAINATRAAVEEGIVPGGGVALLYAIKKLESLTLANDDQNLGLSIVKKALSAPIKQIANNAGVEGSVIVTQLLAQSNYNWGYDAQKNEFGDMIAKGIIDPAKVIRSSLQNAASAAGIALTTEVMITDVADKKSGGPITDPSAMMDY